MDKIIAFSALFLLLLLDAGCKHFKGREQRKRKDEWYKSLNGHDKGRN